MPRENTRWRMRCLKGNLRAFVFRFTADDAVPLTNLETAETNLKLPGLFFLLTQDMCCSVTPSAGPHHNYWPLNDKKQEKWSFFSIRLVRYAATEQRCSVVEKGICKCSPALGGVRLRYGVQWSRVTPNAACLKHCNCIVQVNLNHFANGNLDAKLGSFGSPS